MDTPDKLRRFEQTVLPHLDAAYNLARWLTHDSHNAEDIVQEACLRAFKFFDGFRGDNGRYWLLKIVRNTFYTWREQNRHEHQFHSLDEEALEIESGEDSPEAIHQKSLDTELLRSVLGELPEEFREIIVLREIEGCSYKEISSIVDIPMGTVMSRLARARKHLERRLSTRLAGEH